MTELFAGILGHDRPKAALTRALASGRVHHAWLFAGRDGVGKTLFAHRLAQLLLCQNSEVGLGEEALVACGSCRHCRRVLSDGHPDLTQLRADGQVIKIAQVRALQQTVSYKPFEARFRVVIIHEAHRLRDASANALLKTLEEPTDRTIFVLVTDQVHALLPTIISRCQMLRFAPFDVPQVRDFLVARGVALPQAELVAVLAEGSFARAESLAEDGEIGKHAEAIEALLALDPTDPAAILDAAAQSSSDETLRALLMMLRAYLRDLMLLAQGSAGERLGMSWRSAMLAERARNLRPDAVTSALDLLGEIEAALLGNVNAQLAAEHLYFGLTGLLGTVSRA